MKKILILGGNSDIGKALIKKLINKKKFSIHVHYNKEKYVESNNIKLIKCDFSAIESKNIKNVN